jgi:hypothetical protein
VSQRYGVKIEMAGARNDLDLVETRRGVCVDTANVRNGDECDL